MCRMQVVSSRIWTLVAGFRSKHHDLLHIDLWQHVRCGFQNRMLHVSLYKQETAEMNHVNGARRKNVWASRNYIKTKAFRVSGQSIREQWVDTLSRRGQVALGWEPSKKKGTDYVCPNIVSIIAVPRLSLSLSLSVRYKEENLYFYA